jgi:hypothetical protein
VGCRVSGVVFQGWHVGVGAQEVAGGRTREADEGRDEKGMLHVCMLELHVCNARARHAWTQTRARVMYDMQASQVSMHAPLHTRDLLACLPAALEGRTDDDIDTCALSCKFLPNLIGPTLTGLRDGRVVGTRRARGRGRGRGRGQGRGRGGGWGEREREREGGREGRRGKG